MRTARDILIRESITLPEEIKHRIVKDVQISFHFEDGKIHHVKPKKKISERLANSCLKNQFTVYKNWSFLDEKEVEI